MIPEMNRQKSLNRITALSAWSVQAIKDQNEMDLYDINLISEDFLVELFREVYDYTELINLNSEEANYPGIDLADETAGVAIQVTSNKRNLKVKETLEKFVANKEYKRFRRLIVYIITEKQKTYAGEGWQAIIAGHFEFDKKRDIRDHGDLLRDINDLTLDKVQRVEAIYEKYFGSDDPEPSAELLAPYLTAVVRRNRNLPLATLDPAQESTPIDLGEVFINLDAGLARVVLPGAQPGRKRYEQYSAALAHIHEKEHIVLLGDPGSGKSTLLRWQRGKEKAEGEELPQSLVPLGDQQQLERLLWEIAWEAHSKAKERDKAADIPEMAVLEIARKHLGSFGRAEQFTEYTEERAHILVGRGGTADRHFTFPHRTFQEYLAACHLASRRRFPHDAAKLAVEGDIWREVLNLAAGTLVFNQNNREKALDGVEKVLPARTPGETDEAGWFRVWLAAEMALVVGREAAMQDEVGAELLPRLLAQLAALVSGGHLTPKQRAEAGESLGWLGDSRPDVACDLPFMVEIPAGLFLMGSDKSADKLAYDREEPQHPLELPVYAIGKYQVTVSQFKRFIEAGGYEEVAFWTKAGWERRQREKWTETRYWDDPRWNVPNHPVVGVSWYEAAAYCAWLKAMTGRDFRLPDEAMWEKAARGADGRIWPWGSEWDSSLLNCGETGINRTTAVGAFPGDCSPYGIYDTASNVNEWCSGLSYSRVSYPFAQKSYEEDLQGDGSRIWRGGAFNFDRRDTRAAYRDSINPGPRNDDLGFRVAEHLSDPAS